MVVWISFLLCAYYSNDIMVCYISHKVVLDCVSSLIHDYVLYCSVIQLHTEFNVNVSIKNPIS